MQDFVGQPVQISNPAGLWQFGEPTVFVSNRVPYMCWPWSIFLVRAVCRSVYYCPLWHWWLKMQYICVRWSTLRQLFSLVVFKTILVFRNMHTSTLWGGLPPSWGNLKNLSKLYVWLRVRFIYLGCGAKLRILRMFHFSFSNHVWTVVSAPPVQADIQ